MPCSGSSNLRIPGIADQDIAPWARPHFRRWKNEEPQLRLLSLSTEGGWKVSMNSGYENLIR
jgi:hypothetical protein